MKTRSIPQQVTRTCMHMYVYIHIQIYIQIIIIQEEIVNLGKGGVGGAEGGEGVFRKNLHL